MKKGHVKVKVMVSNEEVYWKEDCWNVWNMSRQLVHNKDF